MPKIIIILLLLLGSGYFIYSNINSKSYIDHDTLIKGNYQVDENKDVVMVAGSKLTVEGDASINGVLECDKGPIYLEVKGELKVGGKLECQREEQEVSGKVGMGVVIVAKNKLTFDKNSKVLTNGHIQIVDSVEKIASDEQAIEKVYEETNSNTSDGAIRIGPFVPEGSNKRAKITSLNLSAPKINLVRNAKAADEEPDIHIAGDWKIGPPPRGVRRQIILIDPGAKSIKFDGSIEGPPGLGGEDILSGCNIDIPKQESASDKKDKDALSARFRSGKIIIGNFKMILGKGGNGGNVSTSKDCEPKAYAKAGDGGQSGNIKISAQTEIIIEESFTIIPGQGGNGGYAIATAKNGDDGNPGKNGSDAEAVGGNGADNIKSLKVEGDVAGLNKIIIGSVIGGDGGDATASPGNGGKGTGEKCLGGLRGVGKATAGKGGQASFTYPPAIQSTADAYDEDGKDGNKTVSIAKDGDDDPSCNPPIKAAPSQPAKSSGNSAKSSTSSSSKGLTGQVYFFHGSEGSGSTSSSDPSGDARAALVSNYPSGLAREAGGVKWGYYTPLKVELKVGNKLVWQTTITSGSCNDEMSEASCSIDGYKYDSAWDGYTFDMKVYDKDGKLRASFLRKPSAWRPSCTGADCPPPFIAAPKP